MQTRRLGWTDLELTVIGFGTWAHGGGGWRYSWGPQDDGESIAAIHRALDLGINWIDTAPVYGLGHAEEVLGRALRERRARPLVATKCGLVWDKDGRIENCLTRASVLAEAEASLRRLGVDAIDLYQIHWPNPECDIEEAWEAVARLRQQGKIRFAGVSNFTVAHMRRAGARHRVASLQPPYSLLRRDVEAETLPFCQAQSIGVVVYSPLQKGLLAGKMSEARISALPKDDHRRGDPNFLSPRLDVNLHVVDGLRAIAEPQGRTVGQLAIAWTLRSTVVTAAIVGARRSDQIEELAAAADWRLSADELTTIDSLLAERDHALARC
jgi:aryl-alcohol dehydrogenase-like predicted oxidoreductase